MTNTLQTITIKEIPKELYPMTDQKIGLVYEANLRKKTLSNIKGIKSLYDPGIFKNNGKICAVKAFFIKGNNRHDLIENYKAAFRNNDFYIFPKFDNKYEFNVDGKKFYLQIKNDKKLYINSRYIFDRTVNYDTFIHNNEYLYIYDFRSYHDVLEKAYLINGYFVLLYSSQIEIDGMFVVGENFKLSEYQAEEIFYFGDKQEEIKKGSIIIYEVKSCNNLSGLLDQMVKHYYFLEKYFRTFKKYDIKNFVYIGFVKETESITLNEEIIQKIKGFSFPFILIRFLDKIFGENIFFDDTEINDICDIKYLIQENIQYVNDMNLKMDNMEKKFDSKLTNIEQSINQIKELIKSLHSENIGNDNVDDSRNKNQNYNNDKNLNHRNL